MRAPDIHCLESWARYPFFPRRFNEIVEKSVSSKEGGERFRYYYPWICVDLIALLKKGEGEVFVSICDTKNGRTFRFCLIMRQRGY